MLQVSHMVKYFAKLGLVCYTVTAARDLAH